MDSVAVALRASSRSTDFIMIDGSVWACLVLTNRWRRIASLKRKVSTSSSITAWLASMLIFSPCPAAGVVVAGKVAGKTHPYRLFTDPAEAFRAVDSATGAALCAEVDAITERVRGVPRELRVTRELLARRVSTGLAEVSAALAMSERSVQRVLSRHGTSFHAEVITARFALAREILRASDEKLAQVCTQVGISERALTLLFRKQTGLTPAEWRKQAR